MKKYKFALILLSALFVLSAAAALFSSLYSHFQEQAHQKRLARAAAFKLQEGEFRELSAEHAEWRKLPDELRSFHRERIISMEDFAVLRRDLNARLDDNGFHGANISFQFGSKQYGMRKATISFTLNGGYRELKKFVFDMEKSPKMHFFNRIAFGHSGMTVSGGFSMEAYLGE